QVAGLRIILKRRVLAVVIFDEQTGYRIEMAAVTSCRTVGIDRLQIEAALEGTPAYPVRIQQIAKVRSGHLNRLTGAREANVAGRLRIGDESAFQDDQRVGRSRDSAVGLARNQIDMPQQGTAESSPVRIIAHRKMLRVVPQRSHRVAVEIAHHERAAMTVIRATRRQLGKGREL